MDTNMLNGNPVKLLQKLIATNEFLFHITNKEGLETILNDGQIKPLTIDGTRQPYLDKLGKKEKGTASFTSNPISLYEEVWIEAFENRDYVMVFDRESLTKQNVKPAIYISELLLAKKYLEDYRYAVEEAEFECEWRSTNAVDITDALLFVCKVPERISGDGANFMFAQ